MNSKWYIVKTQYKVFGNVEDGFLRQEFTDEEAELVRLIEKESGEILFFYPESMSFDDMVAHYTLKKMKKEIRDQEERTHKMMMWKDNIPSTFRGLVSLINTQHERNGND